MRWHVSDVSPGTNLIVRGSEFFFFFFGLPHVISLHICVFLIAGGKIQQYSEINKQVRKLPAVIQIHLTSCVCVCVRERERESLSSRA